MATTIQVLIQQPCTNPVYIRWKNILGGWDSWLFEWSQNSSLNVNQGQEYRTSVSDLTTATEVLQYYKKEGRNILTLFAEQLSNNEVETIRKIALSPKVEMLEAAGASPLVWFTVLVDSADIGTYETENNLSSISFNIRLLELQTISN